MIDNDQKEKLLILARQSINEFFTNLKPTIKKEEISNENFGVFVTLHKNNNLRGCIGYIESPLSLYNTIINVAKAAAFKDPRFSPVTNEELNEIKIEISILTPKKLIEVTKAEEYLDKIKIGRDGLIIDGKYGQGLLLPQVPIEYNWSVEEFLMHLSMKANLDKNAWKDLDNKIYAFQAEVFSE
ncbi:MAG: AmmeMemoRadiSam system protein A [Nanoarchaeota archaeon]